MKIIHALEEFTNQDKPVILAAGCFDGLHIGHAAVIQKAIERAREINGEAWVFTFDPHPAKVLMPDRAPPLIFTTNQQSSHLQEMGVEYFNRETDTSKGYESSITVDVTTSVDAAHFQRISVRGTVTEGNMMISRINDFDKLYFEPVGAAALFIYKDRPGVIGQIGNALAEAGINIEDMRNPHDPSGENSLAILRTNEQVDCTVTEDIAAKIEALHASCVSY